MKKLVSTVIAAVSALSMASVAFAVPAGGNTEKAISVVTDENQEPGKVPPPATKKAPKAHKEHKKSMKKKEHKKSMKKKAAPPKESQQPAQPASSGK